jgi:hypothetical protein
MARHEDERREATKINLAFSDSRYNPEDVTTFFMTESVLEKSLATLGRLNEIGVYSASIEVPSHLLLINGTTPPFRLKLLFQVSQTGWTVCLINLEKKEMYVSIPERFAL